MIPIARGAEQSVGIRLLTLNTQTIFPDSETNKIMKRKLSCLILTIALVLSIIPIPSIPSHAANSTVISSVEVTQVMGKGVDINSGEYYFMNTFVSGKPTTIQVVLTDTEKIGQDDYVNIYKEDALLTTVYPDKTGERQLLTFTPSRSAVNGWAAGRYRFEANINGSTKTTESA
jgi:hypothetical protein